MRWLAFVLCACVVGGCGDDSEIDFTFAFVDGQRDNPATGTDINTLAVDLKQSDAPVQTITTPVSDGQFSLDLNLFSLNTRAQLHATFSGPTTTLIGAPPPFIPSFIGEFVNVVVGPPASCNVIAGLALQTPRAGGGATLYEQFVFLGGGNAPPRRPSRVCRSLELGEQGVPKRQPQPDGPCGGCRAVQWPRVGRIR